MKWYENVLSAFLLLKMGVHSFKISNAKTYTLVYLKPNASVLPSLNFFFFRYYGSRRRTSHCARHGMKLSKCLEMLSNSVAKLSKKSRAFVNAASPCFHLVKSSGHEFPR